MGEPCFVKFFNVLWQVLFVDDDSQELAPLRHSALTVHAKGNGMGERDMMDILDLLGLQQEAWASDCYDYWHALRDPLASKPFAITIFNRKHIPIRASRHIAMLEAEFAGRKSSLRRFTLLMREPLLFLSIAQQAYVKHVSLTGDTQFSLKSLAPVIQGVEEHFGVGDLMPPLDPLETCSCCEGSLLRWRASPATAMEKWPCQW